MQPDEGCRLYLATPQLVDVAAAQRLAPLLTEALQSADIACLLLRVGDGAGDALVVDAAMLLGPIAQRAGAAFLVGGRADLVATTGADGVHLARCDEYGPARRRLGSESIIGVAGGSRHATMGAAEQDADYVAFGDFDDAAPTAGTLALVEWWSPLMTVPCVACGGTDEATLRALAAGGADFAAVTLVADAVGGGRRTDWRALAAALTR